MSSNHTTALRRRMLMFGLESRQLSRRDRSRCLVDCCVQFDGLALIPTKGSAYLKAVNVVDVSVSLRVRGGRSLLTIVIGAPFDRRNPSNWLIVVFVSNAAPHDLVNPGQSSAVFGSVRSRPSCLPTSPGFMLVD